MYRSPRTAAVVTLIVLVLRCSLPALAATAARIEGTLEIPCDPSRMSEVASVRIRPISGGPATTVPVDPSTGAFVSPELAEGEYELVAIGVGGEPLSPEPKRLLLGSGLNKIVLSMQPPGCGEQDSDRDGERKKARRKRDGLKDWHLTVIYFGVVAVAALALSDDADEDTASPSRP